MTTDRSHPDCWTGERYAHTCARPSGRQCLGDAPSRKAVTPMTDRIDTKETTMTRKIIFAVHLDNGEVLTSVPIEGDDEVNRTLQIVENFTTKTSIAFALSDTLRVTVSAKRIAYITSQAITEDGGAP